MRGQTVGGGFLGRGFLERGFLGRAFLSRLYPILRERVLLYKNVSTF